MGNEEVEKIVELIVKKGKSTEPNTVLLIEGINEEIYANVIQGLKGGLKKDALFIDYQAYMEHRYLIDRLKTRLSSEKMRNKKIGWIIVTGAERGGERGWKGKLFGTLVGLRTRCNHAVVIMLPGQVVRIDSIEKYARPIYLGKCFWVYDKKKGELVDVEEYEEGKRITTTGYRFELEE